MRQDLHGALRRRHGEVFAGWVGVTFVQRHLPYGYDYKGKQ